jgi:hypothetical protein
VNDFEVKVTEFEKLALAVLDNESQPNVEWWREITDDLVEAGMALVEQVDAMERRFTGIREEVDRCLLELRGMRCEMEHVQGKHAHAER